MFNHLGRAGRFQSRSWASLLLCLWVSAAGGQAPPPATEADAADRREQQAMERFLGLLERAPRRGVSLDRVYGYHVERGTLDGFIKGYEARVAKAPEDGAGWMVLGLLESQRGRDAAAVTALRRAEAARPADPLPSYYLGQALVLVGQPEEAAAAFERALQRKPARNDLLEIFQALGRVFQRAQKTREAAAVWQRLEAIFPGDLRVQEQIAAALAEEGQPEQALPRYEALAKSDRDPFRQFQHALAAADLKVRMGHSDEALHNFEGLLARARPDSWIYKEVRRKIEDVFLRNDDQNGLAVYYERWVARNPEDVEALVRLGRSLAAQGRVAEAQKWYEKAITLAPTRRELRLALIGQLVQDRKFAEAAAQYEEMDRAEPGNPDTLRDWGALLLRDVSRPEPRRQADAAAVWRRLLDARPRDPVTTAQVADLFRQASLVDEALALYRKAIELAPHNAQYLEYLGEYLHALKRPDEAQAAWRRIAEGADRNVKSLTRLSEVLSGFGYLKEAVAPLSEAVALEGDDFTLRLKLADLLHRLERHDDTRAQLDAAERLASTDEERTAALQAQVRNDQDGGRLGERIEQLRRELEASPTAGAARWARLARYLEADGKLPEANRAVERAIQADPRSVPSWALAAKLRESAGNLGDAADAFRRLAEIDRRNRTEYLTGVAKLEARLGRVDAALKAGRDLIAAAPGNPEHYEVFAELCFQLGKADEGLDALRRAVRVNPNETKIILTLAETLAAQFRTEEAIETYWRAFDKAGDLDEKLGMITRLTALYLQRNQLDRLLGRLQREQNESQGAQQQRELAVCLAQAYAASGDLGMARSELERLLSANARDTQLLQQLSKLAEEEGDLESAAKYQKQLIELAPSDEGSVRLAQLYVRFGDLDEAQALWTRMASGQSQPHRVFQAIDSLLAGDKVRSVLDITESMLRKDPRDWEALYREGVALAGLDRAEDARRRFRALVDLRVEDDEKSSIVKARTRDPKLQATGTRLSRYGRTPPTPLEDRLSAAQEIRMATNLESRAAYYGTSRPPTTVWAPADYGQARMAALGWLLAESRKLKEGDEVLLAEFRVAGTKTPVDPQRLWDWYYFSLVRNDSRESADAARGLSYSLPNDPTVLWAYLTALGQRQYGQGTRYYVAPGTDTADAAPPLPPAEVEHMLACYRALHQRRPELVNGSIVQNVVVELKRAKRTEEGDRIYRDAVEGAEQLGQVAAVFTLAAQRGDVDALLRLLEKFDRLQTGPSTTYMSGSFYFRGPGTALSQGMSVRAGAKAYGDVLRMLDHYLSLARRRHEQQSAGAAARARRSAAAYPAGYTPNYQVWVGRTTRNVRLAFPLPNEYYDDGAITVLRTAYELYKRDDLSSDLAAHFRKQAEAAATPPEALYPRLALSYLAWWDDDKDAAIADFARAAETTKLESDVRLTLAELYEKRGDPAEALVLVDAVKPLDNATMQRREEQALRLAVLTGNLGRAREAAERLFGLRLDTDTQVRLAGQMHQLGMHELAEAVLGRARRRAGGKATALVGLMLQYLRQDRTDVAVQVALQIIRSTSGLRYTNPYMYSSNDPDASRTSAISVLARSGRLKGLIARVQEQLQRSPGAVQLLQALAEYYKADGQRDQARATLAKIAELRPDDAALRFQIANQLVQDGQAAEAIAHYKAALKKDPGLFGRSYWEIQRTFQQANKSEELADLLEEIDIRALGQSYYVTNLIQELISDDKTRERAMALFRKAWAAFPNDRSNLISSLYRDEMWHAPEMYDYARQALIPEDGVLPPYGQWNVFSNYMSYSGDGRITGVMSRLLDLAAGQDKLAELAAAVDAARARTPRWLVGKAILGLIDCRRGKFDEARPLIRELLDVATDEGISARSFWVMASELENYAPTHDLAMTLYEHCLTDHADDPYTVFNYTYSPIKRLVKLYQEQGRLDDVRRVLVEYARPKEFPSNYDENYLTQMRMQGLSMAAKQLVELGFTAEAVPMFGESLAVAETIAPGADYYIGNRESLLQQTREGLSLALRGLDPDQLVPTIERLLQPQAAAADKEKKENAPARDQAVELVLLIHPRELDKAAVRSLFAEAVTACAREPGRPEKVDETLAALRQRYPDDDSVRIASALTALASKEPGRIASELEGLEKFLAGHPLEPLGERARANARQRTEAARRLPLWLVARGCWEFDSVHPQGDRLAALALEAARRQPDNRWTLAIEREQGQHALDRGDTAGAEVAWGRMLERILSRTSAPAQAPAPAPAAAPAPKPGSAAAPASAAILTLDRFEQAMHVARLAAAHGLHALGVRAVRESLEGGPPVVVTNDAQARRVVRNPGELEAPDQVTPRVIAQFVDLEGVWLRRQAPAGIVYEALRDAALPPGRPAEIFLYAQPLNAGTVRHPRSLGAMLARWAIRAGKTDDLLRAVDARRGQPMSELPAAVLTAQLALAGGGGDPRDALGALTELLRKNALRSSAELACHAAVPGLAREDTGASALALLEVVLGGFAANDAAQSLQSLLTLAAHHELKHGDTAGARKRLDAYLDAVERSFANYGGDYPVFQRKRALQNVASEFARAGAWSEALESLGRFVDAPAYSGGDPPVDDALALLLRGLSARPARERYDILKAWTMPAPNRRVVRMLAALGSSGEAPAEFARGIGRDAGPPEELISTATALVESARAAGTLDALADEARSAAGESIENAESLSSLIELARGRTDVVRGRIEGRIAALKKEAEERAKPEETAPDRPPMRNQKPLSFPWSDYLLARAALAQDEPGVLELGYRLAEALGERATLVDQYAVLPRLESDLARERIRRAGSSLAAQPRDGGLAHWHPARTASRYMQQSGSTPSWWTAHQGHVARLAGSQGDFLLFDYPLAGTYEVSVEALGLGMGLSSVTHDGLLIQPSISSYFQVAPVGENETVHLPWRSSRPDDYNRLTIAVEPGKVRYLVNGHLLHEELDPATTAPWLGFFTQGYRPTAWRNFSLRGAAEIPREVRLSHADRLDGWVSGYYNETQPSRLTKPGFDEYGNESRVSLRGVRTPAGRKAAAAAPIEPDDYDWCSLEGVIHGRRLLSAKPTPRNYNEVEEIDSFDGSAANQSRLYYFRPLRNGETIGYEFYFEPDQVLVHPALDRLAFLLEPGGVRLHWMTATAGETSGIPPDNVIDAPEGRLGAGDLSLKPGQWNTLTLSIVEDSVRLELNGQAIYERALEPANSRQFGFYHDKDRTSVRVRNVVLRGSWPEVSSESLARLVSLEPAKAGGAADRRARHALIGETVFGLEADAVLRRASGQEPAERYSRLADWVLPGPDHPGFRLEGAFTPGDSASGGAIVAPAIELVETARSLGKLDELAERIGVAPLDDAVDERGRLALRALIGLAREDEAMAGSALAAMKPRLEQLGPDQPPWTRWPELVAASRAITGPSTRGRALELLETMAGQVESRKELRGLWDDHIQNLRAQARLLVEPGAPPDGTLWTAVSHTRSQTRGTGEPVVRWTDRQGRLAHEPGHAHDHLYLNVPIRGEFQVDAELTSSAARAIRLTYAGLSIAPKDDLKHVVRSRFDQALPQLALTPPLEKPGEWFRYRLVVRPGSLAVFVDGRQIHQAPLPAECDPWLALSCEAPHEGSARNLRISGTPTVPEQLNLSATPDLAGWLADDFGDSIAGDRADWTKRGDEIVGRLHEDLPGSKLESLARYHRPLVEDGEIAYEFYYEPGKTLTHPALGPEAFLLDPDGVKIHHLTDGAYERSGRTPDNATVEPESRRGPASLPLKAKAWNHAALTLKGDTLTLRLNGEPICERRIESSTPRLFGLFHFADETEVRVRNVTYRGDWPRRLPEGLTRP
jgi:tetratricopeptide (TPR) repeat protein